MHALSFGDTDVRETILPLWMKKVGRRYTAATIAAF